MTDLAKSPDTALPLGATVTNEGACHFNVWAPEHEHVSVRVLDMNVSRRLERTEHGYHRGTLNGVRPGSRYYYQLEDGSDRPDPASRYQPEGVHGPSEVVDLSFDWSDRGWPGLPVTDYVLYELHVGTFTEQGSFDGVAQHLDRLGELGVTAIEIMPVSQFPGSRNWGYDGVYPFAVQASYGGPRGLQHLVDACHAQQIAVVLDVVYNHLGPEGNYLGEFGPYFTDVYRTPWGSAINFDGPHSGGVRRYFIDNALSWIRDFHVDALRLDAVHAILDRSPLHFLEELGERVHALAKRLGRNVAVIAESDSNDPRLVRNRCVGGYGLDAMWCDDLHHSAHTLLTGERSGYYSDFGRVEHLARAWSRGMTYAGNYSVYRRRRQGRRFDEIEPRQVIVCLQNHDQVGNRMLGDRLTANIDFEAEKLAAGVAVLSPFVPLLFMGQEYGETAPFQYFISHGDPALVEAVRTGRKHEFRSFGWTGEVPDPQGEQTFLACRLNHQKRHHQRHRLLYELYRQLLALRKEVAATARDDALAFEDTKTLLVLRDRWAWMVFHFGSETAELELPVRPGSFRRSFDSADAQWDGPGTLQGSRVESTGKVRAIVPAHSFFVYTSADAIPV